VQKVFCDKCGVEIKAYSWELNHISFKWKEAERHFELCDAHSEEAKKLIMDWMGSK
jgi:hypothetical protein